MEIILNEYNKALEILENKDIKRNTVQYLSILAKYYSLNNISDLDLYITLDNFMAYNFPYYNPIKWADCINKQIKNAKKYKLIKIDYIPVTENELKTIKEKAKGNKRLERVIFSLLILAKYYNLVNPKNNNWTNKDIKTIFSLSNLAVTEDKQCEILHKAKELGVIKTSNKIDNLNLNVQIIDDESPVVLKITDMRDLGNQYRMFNGDKYKFCKNCNRVIKIKTNISYCKECSKEIKKENDRNRKRKERNK